MSYSLSLVDRKKLFEQENLTLSNTIASCEMGDLEKETAYKVKKLAAFEDQLSPKQLISLGYRKNIDFIIQNSIQPLSEKIKVVGVLDRNDGSFFKDNFTFLSNVVARHKIVFDSSTPRKAILNLAFHRLQIDIEASRSHRLKAALEELVMNAQIDAKKLSDPKSNYKSKLILEKNDQLVAVTVIDTYGTLIYAKFLAQIESCLEIGVSSSINQNRTKGAGIGSSIIYEAMDSLYMGCLPGEKTRVTAVIPFKLSEKNQEKLQKSIFLL